MIVTMATEYVTDAYYPKLIIYGRHTDLVGQYKKNVCQMFVDSISWNDFHFLWICRWPGQIDKIC